MIVTFCGHRDVTNEAEVKKQLVEIIKKLILRGAKEFYLGGYGHFDLLAAKAVKQLQKEYPQIQSILILPYLNQNYDTPMYDASIYPPIEATPKKYAILKRNAWMVDSADIIVAYVKYPFGGAAKTLEYAQRKRKEIIAL
ncbi:MAG: DUF1273 family protein [Clostridia bacterium]|nr:DUF1273 family protein [Clostridia bacterium]